MNNLVKRIDNNSIEVNIAEMVKEKYKIPMQYEEIRVGGNSEDLHYLCRKIDRYLLHIIEEICEFLTDYDKTENGIDNFEFDPKKHNYCLMELIDVIGYTTSLLSILLIDLHGLDYFQSRYKNYFTIEDSDLATEAYINSTRQTIHSSLLNAEKILINDVRRHFPERKWHKDTDRTLSIEKLRELYIKCIDGTEKALYELLFLFFVLSKCDCDLFTEMFIQKNEQIYSLKK